MADLKVIPTKTARFAQIVRSVGKPAVHLSFVAPEKDVELQKLLKAHRVMTVHRGGRTGGADFGLVGLRPEKGAQVWVFPKSLKPYVDRRVVGINYDLVDQDFSLGVDPKAAAKSKAWLAKEEQRKAREEKQKEKEERPQKVAAAKAEKKETAAKAKGLKKPSSETVWATESTMPDDPESKIPASAGSLEKEDIVIHLRSIQRNIVRRRYKQAEEAIADLVDQLS